jgi:hypothetical protein
MEIFSVGFMDGAMRYGKRRARCAQTFIAAEKEESAYSSAAGFPARVE